MDVSGWQEEKDDWSLYQRQREYGHEHGSTEVRAPERNTRSRKVHPARESDPRARNNGAKRYFRDPERHGLAKERVSAREDRNLPPDDVKQAHEEVPRDNKRRQQYNPGKYVRLSPKSYYEEQLFASKPPQQAKFPIVFKREEKQPRSIHVYNNKRVSPSAELHRFNEKSQGEERSQQVPRQVHSEQVDDIVLQQLQVDRYGNKLTRRLGVPHRLSSLNESSVLGRESEIGEQEKYRSVSYTYESELRRNESEMSDYRSESPQIYYDPIRLSKQRTSQNHSENYVREAAPPRRAIERYDEHRKQRAPATVLSEAEEVVSAYHVKAHNQQQTAHRQFPPPLPSFSIDAPDIRRSPTTQHVPFVVYEGQGIQRSHLPPIPSQPSQERHYHVAYDHSFPHSRHYARASFPQQDEQARRGIASSVRRSVNTREEMKEFLARKMMDSSTDFINAGFGRPGGGAPLQGGNTYGMRSSDRREHESSVRRFEHALPPTEEKREQSRFSAAEEGAEVDRQRAQRIQEVKDLKRAWNEQIEEKRRRKEEERRALELQERKELEELKAFRNKQKLEMERERTAAAQPSREADKIARAESGSSSVRTSHEKLPEELISKDSKLRSFENADQSSPASHLPDDAMASSRRSQNIPPELINRESKLQSRHVANEEEMDSQALPRIAEDHLTDGVSGEENAGGVEEDGGEQEVETGQPDAHESGVDNYEGSAYRQGEVPAVQEEAAQEEEAQVEEAQEEIARRGHRQRGAEENRNRIDWEALASLPYLKDVRDEATRAVAGPNDLISASSGQQKVAKRSRLGRISLQEESARRVTSRPPRQQGNLKLNKVQAESPTSERKMKLLAHQHSPRIISSSSRLIFYSGPT